MLDFDLAEIYGYSTKAFNQQVRYNLERFPEDFRFQLTWAEAEILTRSKILTLKEEVIISSIYRGASSMDAGRRIITISRSDNAAFYYGMIEELLKERELRLNLYL